MSDFVESAKNFVSAAVSRTGWEAQKQLRVRSKQSELDKLFEQRQKLLNELGLIAINLYQQGALSDPQMARLCASIIELDTDARNRETQLQEIKSETYPADQFAPAPTTNYTPPVSPTPAASPPPTSGATPQAQQCPNCGNPVRPNSLYCRSCGAKIR
jgi:hypothetical protein